MTIKLRGKWRIRNRFIRTCPESSSVLESEIVLKKKSFKSRGLLCVSRLKTFSGRRKDLLGE